MSSEINANEGVEGEMKKYIQSKEEELFEIQKSNEELSEFIDKMKKKNEILGEKLHQKE